MLIGIFLTTMALLALIIAVAQRSPRHRLLHRVSQGGHGDAIWHTVDVGDTGCSDSGGGSDGGGGGGCD